MPIVAIVGDSGSGKTLLCEQVVTALTARGTRVGYLKHAPHGFQPGRPGSDSERVRAAGADPVAVLGPAGAIELLVDQGAPSDQLAMLLGGLRGEVVLVEGFSTGALPKIRVSVEGAVPREVAGTVLAEVTRPADGPFSDHAVTAVLAVLDEAAGQLGPDRVAVEADGVEVPLRGFAHTVLASTIRGVTTPLRGVASDARLVLTLTPRRAAGSGAAEGGSPPG